MDPSDAPATLITPYRDGPLLVRGPFRLQDQEGNVIDAGRQTVALCRCGRSRLRPFCDGTHRLVRFRAPSGAERREGEAQADARAAGAAPATGSSDEAPEAHASS